ncbi:MAG TPA: RDD family protein [Vicinamibacterales bacterium]|nr:RDD family protein [Vicinamibacterales bacterium]
MKCPKCGYLGFETTDRCRNCQYDFSLAPFTSEPELTLHGTARTSESNADFELPDIKRQTDKLSATALDLDRLFGAPEALSEARPMQPVESRTVPAAEPQRAATVVVDDAATVSQLVPSTQPEPLADVVMAVDANVATPVVPWPAPAPSPSESEEASERHAVVTPGRGAFVHEPPAARASTAPESTAVDEAALPFDEAPILPPAARPPLAVRRSTPEVPRNRPRTTRPVRIDSLDLEPAGPPRTAGTSREASETIALLTEAPTLGARIGAGLIDVLLLAAIDAAVIYLTLRVTGLQNTLDDLRAVPVIPFIGFLAMLAFGYVAAFTVAGGQTIGKMMLSLRVIGDDGRPVDAAGGMLRALGCMLVPVTLGLSYLPAVFTSDHRALHDRLAGTRVVQE